MEAKDIQSLITQRRSVRTFSDRTPDEATQEQIAEFLAKPVDAPFGHLAEFHLLRTGNDKDGRRQKLGTYGFISGAPLSVAGVTIDDPGAMVDYGFQLETIILRLTGLGLGTCWLGGTFSRSVFSRMLGVGIDKLIPAVTPLGYPAEKQAVREKLIRRIATADRRKPLEEICDRHALKVRDVRFRQALEMVRLAPSAENLQPWRIVKSGHYFHFYLKRSGGMLGNQLMERLQLIDVGIAMSHWEASLAESGVRGAWALLQEREWEQPEGLRYILSWSQQS